ncbi:hypothetical protein RHS03_02509, partial [Rhizoctonia solani]
MEVLGAGNIYNVSEGLGGAWTRARSSELRLSRETGERVQLAGLKSDLATNANWANGGIGIACSLTPLRHSVDDHSQLHLKSSNTLADLLEHNRATSDVTYIFPPPHTTSYPRSLQRFFDETTSTPCTTMNKGNPSPKHKTPGAVPVAVKSSVYDRLAGAGGGAALAGASVLPSPINSVTNSSGTEPRVYFSPCRLCVMPYLARIRPSESGTYSSVRAMLRCASA